MRLVARHLLLSVVQLLGQLREQLPQLLAVQSLAAERHLIHPGGPLAALQLVQQFLDSSDTQFRDLFRLNKRQFWQLLDWLQHHGLTDSRFQTAPQKLIIFLWILAHSEPQRNTAHRFICAQSTVSAVFHTLLPLMVQLFQGFVKQPAASFVSPDVELAPPGVERSRYDGFSGCIGAIDGTLLNVSVPLAQQPAWRTGRHPGPPKQNIFAAVYFSEAFAYVLAGAEGSIHDNRMLREALARSFRLPVARFYLADAEFGMRQGILTPFVGRRYHLEEQHTIGQDPATAKELYNLHHTRALGVVERVFGKVKRKWEVLRSTPPQYSVGDQRDLVYAVCGLWNFLLYDGKEPCEGYELKALTDRQRSVLEEARQRCGQRVGGQGSAELREEIRHYLWDQYGHSGDGETPADISGDRQSVEDGHG